VNKLVVVALVVCAFLAGFLGKGLVTGSPGTEVEPEWQPPGDDDLEAWLDEHVPVDDPADVQASDPAGDSAQAVDEVTEKAEPEDPPQDDMGMLSAIGYTEGTVDENPENTGTLVKVEQGMQPGINFYASRGGPSAYLIDADGTVLHQWKHGKEPIQHAHLFPNGDVIAVVPGLVMFKVDKDSNLLWSRKGEFHHDFWVTEDGRIHALAHKIEVVPGVHPEGMVQADYLVVLSPDGDTLEVNSLIEPFLRSPYKFVLPSVRHRPVPKEMKPWDLLHANHVEVFDGSLEHVNPLLAEGNILLSFRHIHTIAIYEKDTHDVLWVWGSNNIYFQHHPTLLENGNIQVFNNGLEQTQRSTVIELDLATGELAWEYMAEGFYTMTRGSAQRLPNGNTLIAESDSGYVFEVTREGEVVWEFANPDVDAEGLRNAIWRMTRLDPETLEFELNGGVLPANE
jgi:outer membrane protein assembly factor BamB